MYIYLHTWWTHTYTHGSCTRRSGENASGSLDKVEWSGTENNGRAQWLLALFSVFAASDRPQAHAAPPATTIPPPETHLYLSFPSLSLSRGRSLPSLFFPRCRCCRAEFMYLGPWRLSRRAAALPAKLALFLSRRETARGFDARELSLWLPRALAFFACFFIFAGGAAVAACFRWFFFSFWLVGGMG